MKTQWKPPLEKEQATGSSWQRITTWLVVVAVGIVGLDVYLSVKSSRVLEVNPPTQSASAAEAGRPQPVRDVPPPVPSDPAVTTIPNVAPPVVVAPDPVATNAAAVALRERHLAAQAESLRKEVAERAGDGSLLTPSADEADRVIREGLEIR
jgi:hypothetical protein